MLRTNSKEVKRRVRRYILASYECGMIEYDNNNVDITDFKQVSDSIMYYFNLEYLHYNVDYARGKISKFEAFEDYCQGLPTLLGCEYYLGNAVELLGRWLDETKSECSKYSQIQAEHLITYLIYRELIGGTSE